MPSKGKALREFIDNLKDEKINPQQGIQSGKIDGDGNVHINNKHLTSGDPQKYMLKLVVNNKPEMTSFKEHSGQQVASLEVDRQSTLTAADIKKKLKEGAEANGW
ncbi:hypothetical protein E8E13_004315 [Curvularia kusanoi]|uniref:Uncharacterized protein n=1 Tax=Curvularia kusanoi TaxID=90978 RepID=A0A9P4T726_CURKU|nr:hypothetical protein E8E13_004315 [Curvularia kusanoi]